MRLRRGLVSRHDGCGGGSGKDPLMAVGCLSYRLRLDRNQPRVVDAHPGQRTRLTCRAEGFPPAAIEWQRDGQPLSSPRFVQLLSSPLSCLQPHPTPHMVGDISQHLLYSDGKTVNKRLNCISLYFQ